MVQKNPPQRPRDWKLNGSIGRIEEALGQVSLGHDACFVSTRVGLSVQNVFLISDAQFIEEAIAIAIAIAIAEPW
jgi:hypothetical protein